MTRPRLLFVDNSTETFLSHRLPLARAAADAGWMVHVASPPSPLHGALADQGFTAHALTLSRKGLEPLAEIASVRALHRLVRGLRPDLVHLLRLKPVLYGGIAAYGARAPAVISQFTGLGFVFRAETPLAAALRLALRLPLRLALGHRRQAVIVQNPDDHRRLLRLHLVARRKLVLIRGSGVDVDKLQPTTARRDDPPLVLLPARMLWDKGVGEFVAAARLLRGRQAKVRCALVGDSDPGNPMAVPFAQLQAWRDEGTLDWLGQVPDIQALLARASAVCLPSYGEGLPKSLLEAMACGLPIIAADTPGCREACRHDDNGLLVPPRDPLALADAIERLCADRALAGRLGRRGRERAVAEFAVGRVVAETLAVYASLARNARRGRS